MMYRDVMTSVLLLSDPNLLAAASLPPICASLQGSV